MPNIFDIFGEINLESRAFTNSIRAVGSKLKDTDQALDSTIAKSNKLGDTSATVARRYEKLGEGISAQRQKLLDNALAFEKGEISARKFGSVMTSVDKATASLNSRIKDAKARLSELDETNLTHFQQQIQGATTKMQGASTQATSLFSKLSGYQKTQLSFQLNDVISGLAMGQNPMQILAQQGGQILQIFQMGKTAQEGTAVATTAAATAEAAFAVSAKGAAVSQAQVAVASEATAVAMTEASAATTVMGATVTALGAVLAAGLVSILAAWKASKDVLETAQKRLKNEEAITGEYNKQSELIGALKKQLTSEAKERAFSKFTQSDDSFGLNMGIDTRTRERNAIAAEIEAERGRRDKLLAALPTLGKGYAAGSATPEQVARIKELDAQISALTARVADIRQSSVPSSVDFYTDIQKRQLEVQAQREKNAEQAAKEAADKLKKHIEDVADKAKEAAKKWVEHIKEAKKVAMDVFAASASDNPFVKIFNEGEAAILRVREATKGLSADLQNTLINLAKATSARQLAGQSIDSGLKAFGLRDLARQFDNGLLDENKYRQFEKAIERQENPIVKANMERRLESFKTDDLQKKIDRQLEIIGGRGVTDEFSKYGKFANLFRNPADQSEQDKRIVDLLKTIDPEKLNATQRGIGSDALKRQAAELDREKEEAKKLMEKQNTILDALGKALEKGNIVTIRNEAPNNARVTSNPTAAAATARYE